MDYYSTRVFSPCQSEIFFFMYIKKNPLRRSKGFLSKKRLFPYLFPILSKARRTSTGRAKITVFD